MGECFESVRVFYLATTVVMLQLNTFFFSYRVNFSNRSSICKSQHIAFKPLEETTIKK